MIQFGRELQMLSEQLCREYGKNTMHKKMLQVRPGLVLHCRREARRDWVLLL